MIRILGLLIITVGLLAAIGPNLPAFFDPVSVLFVIVSTIGMLLFGGHSIPTMFKVAFSQNAALDQLQTGARGWKMARWYSLAGGLMGTLIGAVIMLANMDDTAAIGPGLAIAILTVLYGVFLSFFIYLPLQARLEIRIAEETLQHS